MSFQTDIHSSSSWRTEVLGAPGSLQVIDCYQEWAGPCKAIQSTFKRLYYDLGADRGMKFYCVNAAKVPEVSKYKGKCQPVFLLYKDGSLLKAIEGVVAPELTKSIMALSEPKT